MKSLKWKTFVIFVSVFLTALSATFFFVYRIVSEDLKELAVESASYEIEAAVRSLDHELEEMRNTFYVADFSKQIIGELQKPKDEINYQSILLYLEDLLSFSDNVYSIYLHDINNNVCLSTETMSFHRGNTGWFGKYRREDGGLLTLTETLDITSSYNQMISYIGEVKIDFFGDTVAWLSVNMLRHNVQQLIMEDKLYEGSIQYISDENGTVIAKTENFDENVYERAIENGKNKTFISCDGEEYLYLVGMTRRGCSYTKLIPKYEMFAGIREVGKILVACFLFFCALILLIAYRLLDYLTKPIYELSEKIRSYRQAEGVSVVFKTDRKDEFAYLFKSLEDMTGHIDYLIDELYQRDLYKKEMQLKLYRASINPHFIFNILDSITWTLKFKDYKKVEKTLSCFADFFRASLTQNQDYVSIADTKRWLTSYCYLAGFLKDDNIRLVMEVDSELDDVRIPSLLIQPVIENSFKYAFEGNRPGEIRIRIDREGEILSVTIEDNGIGISEEEQEKLCRAMEVYDIHKSTKHFGLASVYQRLKLLYGEAAGFTFTSVQGEGTKVSFHIKA